MFGQVQCKSCGRILFDEDFLVYSFKAVRSQFQREDGLFSEGYNLYINEAICLICNERSKVGGTR
jgi:hypothetical protein